jgi:hypothetical protein
LKSLVALVICCKIFPSVSNYDEWLRFSAVVFSVLSEKCACREIRNTEEWFSTYLQSSDSWRHLIQSLDRLPGIASPIPEFRCYMLFAKDRLEWHVYTFGERSMKPAAGSHGSVFWTLSQQARERKVAEGMIRYCGFLKERKPQSPNSYFGPLRTGNRDAALPA